MGRAIAARSPVDMRGRSTICSTIPDSLDRCEETGRCLTIRPLFQRLSPASALRFCSASPPTGCACRRSRATCWRASLIGPFTPGFVADQKLANELAELGVILLMFGVGLHFSLKDLLAVRAVAVPGAVGQIASATLMGMALAWAMGWPVGAGLVFGLALSVASTVVLLRALQERRLVESERGRIAVGWLIVEDIVMVLTLVLLPPLAGLLGGVSPTNPEDMRLIVWLGMGPIWGTLAITAFKIVAFVTLMLVVGRKVVPWILHHVAHSGSRELFRLSVLAVALGVAFGASSLFGVSFALGAFFAGMVMAESTLSTRPRAIRCRCATRSRCCSSSPSGCCSILA